MWQAGNQLFQKTTKVALVETSFTGLELDEEIL